MAHDAFISYRHGADAALAEAIEHGLERIARPWNKVRAMSVFRDQSDLTAGADLTAKITTTLDTTSYLILLASPESAQSKWVDKEVSYWCDVRHREEQLIVVVTDGEFEWDEDIGALSAATDAVSPAVRQRITTEPLFVDLRWARQVVDLSLRDTRFRAAIVLLAATVRGVMPSALESEDVKLYRHRRRLARMAVAAVVVLALAASAAAVLAIANARRAERRAQEALGRQLGLAALDLPASEVDEAFLLSLVAADLDNDDSDERFLASRALIGRYSRLDRLLHAPPTASDIPDVAISPVDQRIVATSTGSDGAASLLAWPSGSSSDPDVTTLDGEAPTDVFHLDDGALVVVEPGGAASVIRDGTDAVAIAGVLATDAESGLAVVEAGGNELALVELSTGARRATWSGDGDPLADVVGDRAATASGSELTVVGSGSGEVIGPTDTEGEITAVGAGTGDGVAAVTASPTSITAWAATGDELRAAGDIAVPAELGRLRRLVVALDGQRALVVGDGGSAMVNLRTGDVQGLDIGATGLVAVDPSRRYAAVGGARLSIWDLDSGRPSFAVPDPVNAMSWSGCEAGDRCALATVGQSADVWTPATRRHVELLGQTNAQSVAISSDATTVVTAGWGRTVAVWQLRPIVDRSGRAAIQPEEAVRATSGEVLDTTAAADGSIAVNDIATGERLTLDECTGDLSAISPNGEYVVTHARDDRLTTVCSTTDGGVLSRARLGGAWVPAEAVAVDDEGNVAVAGGGGFVSAFQRDGGSFAWGSGIDARLGDEPVTFGVLAYRHGTIAGGLEPPAAGATARVLVWNEAGNGTPAHFEADFLDVPAVALLGSDAELLVTAGRDTADGPVVLQAWETTSNRRLGRALDGLAGGLAVLGGDASNVVAADSAGNAYRWALDLDPTAEICSIVGRPLTEEEWDELAGGALRERTPRQVSATPAPGVAPLGAGSVPVTSVRSAAGG